METRYISLDDAVQCAEDVAVDFENDDFTEMSMGAHTVGVWLKDIPAADVVPAPRWISVTERLPELYQNVLVHYYNPHCVEPHNYAVAFRQNGLDESIPGKHIWHVDSSPLELDGSDVTHWMPLPEPPKEGGGEK